jgi:hypothetical protein
VPDQIISDMRRVGRNQVRATVGLATAALILAVVTIALGTGIITVNSKVNELQQGDTPASTRARQDRAENRFILCLSVSTVLDPRERRELRRLRHPRPRLRLAERQPARLTSPRSKRPVSRRPFGAEMGRFMRVRGQSW